MAKSWYFCPVRRPSARLRLICFPHAGGGATTFREWPAGLPPEIEVWAAQLPGREVRIRETPLASVSAAVPPLADGARELFEGPFALYGHSMGALLAYELARHLEAVANRSPVHLFVAGRQAPHVPDERKCLADLPDAELIEELRQLNGTPAAILENQEMLQLMLPTIRADFALVESYRWEAGQRLRCPLTAMAGLEDSSARPSGLDAWQEQTSAAFKRRMFPGGHFFPSTDEELVLRALAIDLRPALT